MKKRKWRRVLFCSEVLFFQLQALLQKREAQQAAKTRGAGAHKQCAIEVSPVTAVHKAALRSQMLLYQKLHARWNENDIQNFLKTVGFHQKYSDIKKRMKRAVLMFILRSQILLENLFVAVSFDIVAGRHK